jgi:hypothetical protein
MAAEIPSLPFNVAAVLILLQLHCGQRDLNQQMGAGCSSLMFRILHPLESQAMAPS